MTPLPGQSIPAITLREPWASWVAFGWKTIETRRHARFASLVGQWIAVHAGKGWDNAAEFLAEPYLPEESRCHARWAWRNHGRVLCVAHCADHRKLAVADSAAALCSAQGLYGLVFDKIVSLDDHSIATTGHQGIWRWVPPQWVYQRMVAAA